MGEIVHVSFHPHALQLQGPIDMDWACDARDLPHGCGRGFGGQTRGLPRYRCLNGCDYDVCGDCLRRVGGGPMHSASHHGSHHEAHHGGSFLHPMANLEALLAKLNTHVEETVTSDLHPHPLTHVRPVAGVRWACDGRRQPGGCGAQGEPSATVHKDRCVTCAERVTYC